MKKISFVVSAVLTLCLYFLYADAMTLANKPTQGIQASGPSSKVESSNTVYLLSWQDNKLLTTKGTFVTDGIQIVNKSGIDKVKIALQDNNPIVDFVKDGDTIVKIIILPNK